MAGGNRLIILRVICIAYIYLFASHKGNNEIDKNNKMNLSTAYIEAEIDINIHALSKFYLNALS